MLSTSPNVRNGIIWSNRSRTDGFDWTNLAEMCSRNVFSWLTPSSSGKPCNTTAICRGLFSPVIQAHRLAEGAGEYGTVTAGFLQYLLRDLQHTLAHLCTQLGVVLVFIVHGLAATPGRTRTQKMRGVKKTSLENLIVFSRTQGIGKTGCIGKAGRDPLSHTMCTKDGKEGTLSRARRNFEGTLYMHYIRREGQREQEEERH